MIFKGGSGAGVNLSRIRSSRELLEGRRHGLGPGELHARRRRLGRARSSPVARRAGPPRWSSSTPTTPTSRTSSGARRSRSARPASCATPGSTWTSTAPTATRSSTRTPTTRCGSPTSSCRPCSTTPTGTSRRRTDGAVIRTVKARDLFRQIAQAAWECADPGMQFDTTINRWHTAPNTGRINGSQPVLGVHAPRQLGLQPGQPQPAEVPRRRRRRSTSRASRPPSRSCSPPRRSSSATPTTRPRRSPRTPAVPPARPRLRQPRRAAHGPGPALRLRRGPGLGGGDHRADDRPRLRHLGPHRGPHGPVRRLPRERASAMLNVLRMHRAEAAADRRGARPARAALGRPGGLGRRRSSWPSSYGVRNSQATVLAPTGTIGLLMDCDTTGIEPDLGLVKTKKLVGGGTMSIVNQTVPRALRQLGYGAEQIDDIVAYIDEHKSIVGRAAPAPPSTCRSSPARWATTPSTTRATSR